MKYIGIIGRPCDDRITFNQEIVNVIYEYGFIPLGIIVDFNSSIEQLRPLLDKCSGFILQGGSEYYEQDIMIVKHLYEKDIPTLGICLGMQTMSMAFNGQMGAIASHLSNDKYVHDISIIPDSKLYKIMDQDTIMVNSRHRDSILTTDLDISSYHDVIESVEDKSRRFFIGVQWHPESLMDHNSYLLFNAFFASINN